MLALVAGLLGARGLAGIGTTTAKWLVVAFLALVVLSIPL